MINRYEDINSVVRINGQLVINPDSESLGVTEVEGNREYDWCMAWGESNGGILSETTEPEKSLDQVRDEALDAIAYNLDTDTVVDVRTLSDTTGRIIQTRPSDEQRIRNGIRAIELASITSINWRMLDNDKYPVTGEELQTAWDAGVLQGLQIWNDYNTGT